MVLRILSLIFLLTPTTVLSDVGFKDLKIGSDASPITSRNSTVLLNVNFLNFGMFNNVGVAEMEWDSNGI